MERLQKLTLLVLAGTLFLAPSVLLAGDPPAEVTSENPIEMPDRPAKLGVSGTWVGQEQDYVLDQFTITGFRFVGPGFPVPPPPLGPNTIQSIRNEVDSYTARVDYWLLPFFNIYGIVGHAGGEVDVRLGGPINQTFNFEYNGTVYGIGGVAAVGWKDYFLSTDVSYAITDLTDGASIETWVASPKIGMKKGRLTCWVGGTWQSTSHEQSGAFLLAPFLLNYNAILSDENNWNTTVGFQYQLNENWDVKVEGGFGDRHQTLVSIGRRF